MVVSFANDASSCGSLQSALAKSGGMDLVQAASANAVALDKISSFGQVQPQKVNAVLQQMLLFRVASRAHLSAILRVVEVGVMANASADLAVQTRSVARSGV